MNLVPYLGGAVMPPLTPLDGVQCVFFTMSLDFYRLLSEKIDGWFDGRPEVFLADHGTTDKQGLGFMALEWHGYEIDPLFLAILRDEEAVEDYTIYSREVQ